MADRIRFEQVVAERGTCLLTTTLKSETGAALPGSSLATCELTLYDERTGEVLNGRVNQDIKALVDGAGLLSLLLTDADHLVIDDLRQIETHIGLVKFTYGSPVKQGRQEFELNVRNLSFVA